MKLIKKILLILFIIIFSFSVFKFIDKIGKGLEEKQDNSIAKIEYISNVINKTETYYLLNDGSFIHSTKTKGSSEVESCNLSRHSLEVVINDFEKEDGEINYYISDKLVSQSEFLSKCEEVRNN